VRQQASSVYRKAGVSSRNELAAWFFEDMLEPPPVDS
jgi:DNA-binding CsgD family transcriptional regulator